MASIKTKYLHWMYDLCSDDKTNAYDYIKLMRYLYNRNFEYILDLDENREVDGFELRYRFGLENGYSRDEIATAFINKPCSVLEMLVALAFLRCEEQIMKDPDVGDRTGKWFWGMIQNLGLYAMTDDNFNPQVVREAIERFLDRKYDSDGTGGLFTVPNCTQDLRRVEIWYQMCWYLDTIV